MLLLFLLKAVKEVQLLKLNNHFSKKKWKKSYFILVFTAPLVSTVRLLCKFLPSGHLGGTLAAANRGPRIPTNQAAHQSALRESTAGANNSAATRRSLPSVRTYQNHRVKSLRKQIITFELVKKTKTKSHYVVTVGSCRRQKTQSWSSAINHTCLEITQNLRVEIFFFVKVNRNWRESF